MNGLRDFKELDPDRHNPAVGINFGNSNLGKLLIVGESHYSEDADLIRQPKFTHNPIEMIIQGEERIPYFTKVAGLFPNPDGEFYSPAKFYPRVAFYNYLPDSFAKARERFKTDLYRASLAVEFFYKVLNEIKPTHVLVTGGTLWRYLPSDPEPKPATNLRLLLNSEFDECEKHAWLYPTGGDDYALVAGIYHPSSHSFKAREI